MQTHIKDVILLCARLHRVQAAHAIHIANKGQQRANNSEGKNRRHSGERRKSKTKDACKERRI